MVFQKKFYLAIFFASIIFVIVGCGADEPLVGIRMVGPIESDTLSYEDDHIRIEFVNMLIDRVIFTLHNKTESSIRVIWNDGAFIDKDGSMSKLFKTGIRYIERDQPISPTTIPSGSNLREEVLPVDNIYYSSGSTFRAGGWQTGRIIPSGEEAKTYDGAIVSLFLPIEVAGELREYKFDFEIKVISY